MIKVKVLIEGYARQIENGWIASSTVTLVETDGKRVLADPGCNRQRLLDELAKNNLKTSDINFVLLTHTHTDHALLAGIFEKAQVLNSEEIYNNDKQLEYDPKMLGNGLEIISTPCHVDDHCSLVVKTDEGVYVVAGDVFWWKDDEEQKVEIDRPDQAYPRVTNDLAQSRQKILKIADFIIPGHGKMFKNDKSKVNYQPQVY